MFKFLVTITYIHNCICFNHSNILFQEIQAYHSDTYAKADFAYQVVNKIFNAFQQWFFTVTFCEFTYFENRILKYIETYGFGYPIMLLNGCPNRNTTKVKPKINRHGQTAYVVTSNSLTMEGSEEAIEILSKTGVFKPRSVVIFVINTIVTVDSYFYFTMKIHFQLLWSRRITNSVIVLWSDQLKVYTFNPFSDQIKDITQVKDITQLLLGQYHDLYGYVLRLNVFRKIYVSDETGPIVCSSTLPLTVMHHFNATCKPILPRDGSTVGDLLENGTATGVTADLIDGFSDMELSSRILKNSYYGYIDTTYPLDQDELCFLIKKSIRQSTFTTTLQLITIELLMTFVWIVVFLILIALIIRKVEIKIWNIEDRRSSSVTTVDLIKCFIRQTADIKFAGPVFRCTVLMIMMYSLIIDCAIDGIITSAIAYPRFKPDINTISELLETNLTFGVHNRDFMIFNNSLNNEHYAKFKNRVEIVNDRKIKEIIDERQYQYALLLRKSDSDYISRKPSNMKDGRPLFHTVQDCPVPCSIVYGLRYGSPYLPRLNYILHHLNQGGILHYWLQYDEHTMHQSPSTALYSSDSKDRKALTIGNLREVFMVWAVVLLISAISFIFEFLLVAGKLWNVQI